MIRTRYNLVFSLLFLFIAPVGTIFVGNGGKDSSPEVIGDFSPGGRVLTITSQSEFEELWGLQVDYCDGSKEKIGRYQFRIKFRARIGSGGYSFYADKPMRQALIKTLPPVPKGSSAEDFRYTTVRRNCGGDDQLPKLFCNDVSISQVIHRSWEGEAISFKSNRHVIFAGLRFPGVDGLAPTRVPDFHEKRYFPSVKYDPAQRTWTGTFISLRVPVGEYQNVVLLVRDDYGQQAVCDVGKITVLR